jgi:hypothetical protein
MARVGVIVVSYRSDPEPLFTSVASSRHEVRWYIFVHGQDAGLRSKLDAFAAGNNSRYLPYGVNRGVACSWNEGLLASVSDGSDVTIILNDDLFFYDDGFDQFVDFILSEKQRVPDFGLITVYGKEAGAASAGTASVKAGPQDAACMAIGQWALDRVGYFDENFWPAYWEDVDYFYRLELTGLPRLCDQRTLLEHRRSGTARNDRLISLLHQQRWLRNRQYYIKKWGGAWGEEMFRHPFNDRTLDRFIAPENRATPFGPRYDRTDLGSATSAGFLEGNFSEELLAILHRHGAIVRHYLEWGSGESTAAMAEYAKANGAELFLSIDHVAQRLRQTAANIAKHRFLHFRFIDCENLAKSNTDIAYISYPLHLGTQFDVIVIAGKWRMECALSAAAVLAPDGLVIVHDEDRARFRAMRRLLGDDRIAPGTGSAAVVDEWERARDRALRELYEVVEERRQFLVLRHKHPKAELRRRC